MSHNIYIKSRGAEDWKRVLANPEIQWKDGYSAKQLADCWENSESFPKKVKEIFKKAGFIDFQMLLGLPEYSVFLDTGKAPSKSDLFVLAKDNEGLVTIVVEGKASETFGSLIKDWCDCEKDTGKKNRLEFILAKLELKTNIQAIEEYRYQLFHRTASAIIAAEKFTAKKAIMLVHSFSEQQENFEDYTKFVYLLESKIKSPVIDKIYYLGLRSGVKLFIGWIKGCK